jgi:hypothetical protein
MPIYMKAYLLKDLRRFAGWQERAAAPQAPAGGGEPAALVDDTIVYVHEDYRVTSDIYGAVVFDGQEPGWQEFCREQLAFAIPDWDAESAAVRRALAEQDETEVAKAP